MNLASPQKHQEKSQAASSSTSIYVECGGLRVDSRLASFVNDEALPGLDISAQAFWSGLAQIAADFVPRNRKLLAERERLQTAIDDWHRANPDAGTDALAAFLREIGYLVEEPAPFAIGTAGVDPEIASIAGPQLVVPVLNARFLLNAANARWGSLYDALYGTDALDGTLPEGREYDPSRGAKVVAWARDFLDEAVPLAEGSWREWGGERPTLADPSQFIGMAGDNILLRHNGLHLEIVIDARHPVGQGDPAHIADIVLEAALSTIVDLEDSVAAVDAEDKVAAYRNWLGLMRGDLTAKFSKNGNAVTRSIAEDRTIPRQMAPK